jgi:hypothetical protein
MISHQYRFIFVHAGRTGGSSLERMVGVDLTSDLRTRSLGNTEFAEKHKGFQYFRETYPEEFRQYYKFAIVRNPFDRLHSYWKWFTQIVWNRPEMPLRQFIETRPPKYSFAAKYQLEGLSIEDSVATFDYVGRFENLAETYRFLQARLGIPGGAPPHTNSTGARRYQDDYDAATIDLVRRKFAVDLSLFGYDYDG